MKHRRAYWIPLLLAMLILAAASAVLALSVGEINFRPLEVLRLIGSDSLESTIIRDIRLPRVLLAFSVGGALSLAGAILQGIYRNPLVEPYTLGISGGAALGVSIVIATGLYQTAGFLLLPASGFAGALVTVFLVFLLSLRKGMLNTRNMLLTGVMISFASSSAMMFVLSTTTSEEIQNILFWIMGSLNETDRTLIRVTLFASLAGLLIAHLFTKPLNALRIGEVKARHLGINTETSIRLLFILASLLTGISVAVAGLIGFVGLVVPHFVRMIFGSDYRVLLAGSFLGGGIFLILCDILARTLIRPNELPIGVITGLMGGVLFLVVLNRSAKKADPGRS